MDTKGARQIWRKMMMEVRENTSVYKGSESRHLMESAKEVFSELSSDK